MGVVYVLVGVFKGFHIVVAGHGACWLGLFWLHLQDVAQTRSSHVTGYSLKVCP